MLYECHGHIILDGVSYSDSMNRHKNNLDEAFIRQNLMRCKERGIGYYRDGGDKYMVSAFAKKIAPEYDIDYRTPVFITHKKGHYGSMFGRAFNDMRGYLSLVREAKQYGADFIKITVSGMLDLTDGHVSGQSLHFTEIREMVNIGNGEGFHIMAHCNGAGHMKAALEAGVQSIEHGNWPDRDVIQYFLQTGAVWVPTCAAIKNVIHSGRYPDDVLNRICDAQKEILTEAYLKGVLIASGSDCGAYRVIQGQGTTDEYAILNELGIDPERGNKVIQEKFRI